MVMYEVAGAIGDSSALFPAVLGMMLLPAVPAGVATAWLLPGTGDAPGPEELRAARIRQGMFAGVVAGAVFGLLLTLIFVLAVFLMVLAPAVGGLIGAASGAFAADHRRKSRPDRSWGAGLFVSH
jgi:phage shock protein PspC (stress-responsive transcriptional regulator)